MKSEWISENIGLEDCFDVRKKVFVIEQRFDENLEFDDIDATAHHVCTYNRIKMPVATARLYVKNGEYHCGRICVLKGYRGLGLGVKIMKLIEQKAVELGADKLYLSAQTRVSDFYEKVGFVKEGSVYFDEACPHIKMFKPLAPTSDGK